MISLKMHAVLCRYVFIVLRADDHGEGDFLSPTTHILCEHCSGGFFTVLMTKCRVRLQMPVCLHQTAAKYCLPAHPLSAAPGRVQAEKANADFASLRAPGCSGLVIKGEYAMLGSQSQPLGGVGPQRLKNEGV